MPTFQFLCPPCHVREDRIILYEEIPLQACARCGSPLLQEFAPTRSKFSMGARQRARHAAQHGLIELGSATLGEANAEMDRLGREQQAANEAELEKAALGVVEELGGELWTSSPPGGMPPS